MSKQENINGPELKQFYLKEIWKNLELFLKKLPHNNEDEEKINKIWRFYERKRKFKKCHPEVMAGAILWAYARINFLWEHEGKKWMQKNISDVCGISAKVLGRAASALMDELDMEILDARFARQELADKNPMGYMPNEMRIQYNTIHIDYGSRTSGA